MTASATTPCDIGVTVGERKIGTIRVDLPLSAGPISEDGSVTITVDWRASVARALRAFADEIGDDS